MKTFTIENETNDITVYALAADAEAALNSERFTSEEELAKLAAEWPAARLVEIWNSMPAETPVKKFKDRATGVSRIWKVLQRLGEAPASVEPDAATDEAAPVGELPETAPLPEDPASETAVHEAATPEATEPAPSTPVAPQTPDVAPETAPAKNRATGAKKAPVAKSAADAIAPREGSKTSQVIAMLKREGGTTLEDIMAAMGWQKHTTRAMLSAGGSLTKNHGLIVVSEKVGEKRVYSIKA
jgi:Protein of unknown function (DUF3489)